MTEETPQPFVTINLNHQQAHIPISTPEQLVDWLNREQTFWEPMKDRGPIANLYKQSIAIWNELKSQATQYAKNQNEQVKSKINENIAKLRTQGLQFTSEDPRARFAASLYDADPEQAGLSLQYFIGSLPNQPKSYRAGLQSALFELGLIENPDQHLKALEQITSRWSDFTEEATALSSELRESQKILEAKSESLLTEKTSALDKAVSDFNTETQQQLSAANSELENITKTYDEALATQSAVTYWTDRANQHKKSSRLNLVAIVFYVLLLAAATTAVVYYYKPSASDIKEILALEVMATYWPPALLVGLGLVLLWPIRIATRLFLSNAHLHTASEERVTMINTFLALLRAQENTLDEKDRKLILEAIFRHLATGIVKDDGGPSAPLESIGKALRGN